MKKEIWRIIYTEPSCGHWNMALDEAIQFYVGQKISPPTLRLFGWRPPCLSLGHAQPVSDVNLDAIKERNWNLVRRPTGGRAILHTDELTYSIIAPENAPVMAGGVIESYRRISKALLQAMQTLGLSISADKEYDHPEGIKKNGSVCFEVPSNYEIITGNKKLIGSAQARRYEAVLQHGAIPLFGDLTRITQVLHYSSEDKRIRAANRLLDHATNIERALGRIVSWQEAASALENAFIKCLEVDFVKSEPSTQELQKVYELIDKKYGNDIWTFRI